jgi:O-antigen ligase
LIALLQQRVMSDRGLGYPVAAMMLGCLVLGGATTAGFLSDVLLQFAAVPLLLAMLWRYLDLPRADRPRWILRLSVLIFALPLVQLIPLPPQIWTELPGRELVTSSLQLLGGELPWMPISVSPAATWLSMLSLLPPITIFLGTALLGFHDRRLLSLLAVGVGMVSVFLGLAQVAQGPSSPLRFFSNTNPSEAVGFFANRNHFAALLYTLLLFAAAWTIEWALAAAGGPKRRRFETATIVPLLLGSTVLVALLVGQAMARSRAGIGLTIVALLGTFALALRDKRTVSGVTTAKLLVGATVLSALFLLQFALYRILDRFTFDPLVDARIPFARNTITAAKAFMPFGSGIGTFVPVYAGFERPADALANVFANHAHNDVLEVWLEGGVLGAALMGLCVLWLAINALRVWRRPAFGPRAIDAALARAASLAAGLLIAHSFVDYPLRTTAMMSVMAFACALLVSPSHRPAHGEEEQEPAEARAMERNARPRPFAPAAVTPAFGESDVESQAPGERWGAHVRWPEEWRRPSQEKAPHESPAGTRGPRKLYDE